MLKHLVLFDIDGTLLSTGGAGRAALKATLEHVYGESGQIDHYDLGGRTIREIIRDLLHEAGVPDAVIWSRFDAFREVWPVELARIIHDYAIQTHPGTRELVEIMAASDDILPGVLTANIESTARIKLAAAGFDPALFAVGAYGDSSEVRADLVPLAVERAARLTGVRFAQGQVWHIGDTALDVACAREAGVHDITVLTGGHPRAALEAAGAEFIFEDLSDTAAVLETIRGS